jgi:hypothetical protein
MTTPSFPRDDETKLVVARFARWLRIVGSAQLGISSIALALLLFVMGCGAMVGGVVGLASLVAVIPIVIAGVYLFQALRTQSAGEQFGALASEGELDSLEFGFARLRAVVIVDLVVGSLVLASNLLGGG